MNLFEQMKDSPVACTLSDNEFQERRSGLLEKVRDKIQEVKSIDSGYALRFESTDEILEELTRLIQLERSCCQFLKFNLRVLPEQGPIWLELGGPDGTKEFLDSLFDA